MAATDSPSPDDELVAALRAGDEAAFRGLVDRYSPMLLSVAMAHVPSRAAAEEVVQETWVGVIRGIDRFEGRSSLKTWIFRILTNLAMKGGAHERRSVPFAALAAEENSGGPTVDPSRFLPSDHERFPGHWAVPPSAWPTPEERLMAGETRAVVLAALEQLPYAQRTVIGLRDIGGWPAEEVSEALAISAANQRVLLHRARTRIRAALEAHHDSVTPEPATGTEQQ